MNLYSSPQTTTITIYNKDGSIAKIETLELKPMEIKTIE